MARARARLSGARLEVSAARGVRVDPGVRITVDRGTTARLDLAAGVRIHQDVHIQLRGGTVRLGPRSSLRRGTMLNVAGELVLEGDNILGYYNVVHCAERVRLGPFSSASEFSTIVDSRHLHTDDSTFFYKNVETAPIDIGRNVWLANKSSVLMGVTIGDEAIVAAHAVVHQDVPARALVGGIPATLIRQR